MSWSSSFGLRLAYAGGEFVGDDSTLALGLGRPQLSQPEASMRPRARIRSTTAVSRAAGRW